MSSTLPIKFSFYHNDDHDTHKFEEIIKKVESSEADVVVLGGDINSDPTKFRGKVSNLK